jgi:pimeloyl-ACP methyl ester carboxylesterase
LRRRWKILIGILVGLAVLLAVNTVIVDNETKQAAVNFPGAKILSLPGGDLQVADIPAKSSKPGATIVLLPCYACSIHWFERLIPLLSRRHRVVAIDLLGEGGSEKPASGYSVDSEAQDVALALGRLNVQGAVVVGHSLGGAVATALAQRASQLVDRLVIIDEAPDTSFGSLPFLARLSYVPVLGEALRRISPDALVKSSYDDAFAPGYDQSSGFDDPDQVVNDFRAMTYTSFDDLQSEAKDFSNAEPLDSRIRTAAVPLLAIFGTEDQIWDDPRAAAEAYRSVPGAKISMINGAGHSPNVEKPAQTAALIERFSASAPGPAPLPNPSKKPAPPAPPKPNAEANACRPPKAKSIKVAVNSPRQGSQVKSPVTAHVLSVEPANCQATYSITVDGTPYDINGPVKASRPPGPKNPMATKRLHLTPKALRHYRRTPSCTTSRSAYFKLALPKGRHTFAVHDCPNGKGSAATAPTSAKFTVR